jgi:uncharacterized BrkB/YihY/UPF0761 family membrane protein
METDKIKAQPLQYCSRGAAPVQHPPPVPGHLQDTSGTAGTIAGADLLRLVGRRRHERRGFAALFSIAPVLIVITGVAGFVLGQTTAQAEISVAPAFSEPGGRARCRADAQQQVTPTGGIITTIIGLGTLFLTTSAFVNEIRQSMNPCGEYARRLRKTPRPGRPARDDDGSSVQLLLAVGAAVLIMASVAINTAIAIAGSYFRRPPLAAPVLH